MDTILFQNILFSALSVFLVFVTLGFIVCAIFLVLVLKSIHRFFEMLKEEGQKIVSDIDSMRAMAKGGGIKFASLVLSAMSFLKQHKKSKEK